MGCHCMGEVYIAVCCMGLYGSEHYQHTCMGRIVQYGRKVLYESEQVCMGRKVLYGCNLLYGCKHVCMGRIKGSTRRMLSQSTLMGRLHPTDGDELLIVLL